MDNEFVLQSLNLSSVQNGLNSGVQSGTSNIDEDQCSWCSWCSLNEHGHSLDMFQVSTGAHL